MMALLAGCASPAPPPESLERARVEVRNVAADPEIARYARPELEAAQDAFANAELGVRRQLDAQVIDHWAYMAERRAAIARETARLRKAEDDVRAARSESPPEVAVLTPPAPSGAADAAPSPRATIVRLDDGQFEQDRFTPGPEATAVLDRIARLLQEDPSRIARIDGHSDDMEKPNLSLVFAGRRAEAVRGELVQRGVDPRRVQVRALGAAYPVASNETDLGRQRNRRVEVYVLGGGADGLSRP